MQRMGSVIKVNPGKISAYKRLHKAVWPEVLAQIRACNLRNYTILLQEPENLLFSYWEYHGSDFSADMVAMAKDPKTQQWWELTGPCLSPLPGSATDTKLSIMENVFHTD
jgi:L-rhamnose mutarotase